MSDHLPSIVSIRNLKVAKKEPIRITTRDTHRKNIDSLKNSLSLINWSEIIEKNEPNKSMTNIHNKLVEEEEKFTPIKTYSVNPTKARKEAWFTAGIHISLRKCKKIYIDFLHNQCIELRYRAYAKLLQRVKRQVKLSYYGEKCKTYKNNTKRLWQIINKISAWHNDKSSLIDCLKIANVLEYNAKKITEKFREYFSSVGKKFADKVDKPKHSVQYYCNKITRNEKSLFMTPCTETEVGGFMQQLPTKISSGHDNISNILLKSIGAYIVKPLTQVFNNSISMGIFPDVMKLAEVVPLYKSKERFLETNYRPISLLTTMSKLLEKIVYKRVYDFLNNSSQLYESQYGFRRQHSCDNAVGEVVSRIVKTLESGYVSIAIFLDLSKVFDMLKHDLLLHKMEKYGLRGNVLDWFRSYLSNRRIRVKCTTTSSGQSQISEEYPIEYGTPEGSCLGPLLFLIICNDWRLNLQYLQSVQFADDTTLIAGHRNQHYLKYCIKTDLAVVQDWFNENKLTLNLMKTSYMVFQTNSNMTTDLNLTLTGVTLLITHCIKFLGTWLDNKLIWTEHVKRLKTKLSNCLCLLKWNKNLLLTHAMKVLYYAQFHRILSYGISMWGPMSNRSLINQIQKLQDKAVKCIDNGSVKTDVYKTHKILSVDQLIELELCKLEFCLVNNLLPSLLARALQSDQHDRSTAKTHHYHTRRRTVPNLPKATHSRYRSSFLFQAISMYDKLPISITTKTNLKAFIGRCKNYLLNQPDRYTV